MQVLLALILLLGLAADSEARGTMGVWWTYPSGTVTACTALAFKFNVKCNAVLTQILAP